MTSDLSFGDNHNSKSFPSQSFSIPSCGSPLLTPSKPLKEISDSFSGTLPVCSSGHSPSLSPLPPFFFFFFLVALWNMAFLGQASNPSKP